MTPTLMTSEFRRCERLFGGAKPLHPDDLPIPERHYSTPDELEIRSARPGAPARTKCHNDVIVVVRQDADDLETKVFERLAHVDEPSDHAVPAVIGRRDRERVEVDQLDLGIQGIEIRCSAFLKPFEPLLEDREVLFGHGRKVTHDSRVMRVSQDDIETIRGLYERWSQNVGDFAFDLFDEDVDIHQNSDILDTRAAFHGQEGLVAAADALLLSFRGMEWHPEQWLSRGEWLIVSIRVTAVGRQSGVETETRIAHAWRIRGGKITDFHAYPGTTEALDALGLGE
jgi:ketosteroid isomerase-like protein